MRCKKGLGMCSAKRDIQLTLNYLNCLPFLFVMKSDTFSFSLTISEQLFNRILFSHSRMFALSIKRILIDWFLYPTVQVQPK